MKKACACAFLLLSASIACAQANAGIAGSICGSVSDETGTPASNVYVIAMKQDRRGHTGGYPGTLTDETGHYCIDRLDFGQYVLSAADQKKGYPILVLGSQFYTTDYAGPQAAISIQNPEAHLDWQIPFKAGFLRLHVSVNHSGVETVPITFDLVVRSRPKFGFQSVMTSLTTDPRSSITILLPPNENVMLTAMAPGYRHWPDREIGQLLNLRPGEMKDVTISLKATTESH